MNFKKYETWENRLYTASSRSDSSLQATPVVLAETQNDNIQCRVNAVATRIALVIDPHVLVSRTMYGVSEILR